MSKSMSKLNINDSSEPFKIETHHSKNLSNNTQKKSSDVAENVLLQLCNDKYFYRASFFLESNKKIDVISVRSPTDLDSMLKELIMDYRISKKDTNDSLSFLKGIEVDPNYRRSQLFIIKDDKSIIGVSTIIITPFKHISKIVFLKKTDKKKEFVFKSIKEILNINYQESYIIELGWFQLLPKYRGKKIAKNTVAQVLIPLIKKLVLTNFENKKFIIMCSVSGLANPMLKKQIKSKIDNYLENKGNAKIQISDDSFLGKVHPNAKFTSFMSEKNDFKKLTSIYNFGLGPVFARKV